MTASNYAACLTKVLRYEGGYVNNPKDPGGETNYGITIAVARANGYAGSMRDMPLEVAKRIYKAKYWDAVNGDGLPAGLDLCVFDYAVNSGPGRAKPLLAAIGTEGSVSDRIHRYCAKRLVFLKGLKTWGTFGKGWASRVADVEASALRMAAAPVATPSPEAPKAPTQLPVPPKLPTTKQDAKEGAGLVATLLAMAAAWWAVWGATVILGVVLVTLAALFWFVGRPLLRRFWALDEVEAGFLTKLRLALKGVKTKLFSWLLGIAGVALPVLGMAGDMDLSAFLPDIGGIPASTYQYGILALIGLATNALRNATTTPVGQTDLALAPTVEAPPLVPDLEPSEIKEQFDAAQGVLQKPAKPKKKAKSKRKKRARA